MTINANWKFRLDSLEEFDSLCQELNCPVDASEDTSILAEPVKAGNLTIPNSLAVHPMEGADGDSEGDSLGDSEGLSDAEGDKLGDSEGDSLGEGLIAAT